MFCNISEDFDKGQRSLEISVIILVRSFTYYRKRSLTSSFANQIQVTGKKANTVTERDAENIMSLKERITIY